MKKPRFFMVFSGIIGTTTGVIISVLILIFLLGTVIAILVPRLSVNQKTPEQEVSATRTQRIVWGPNNGSNEEITTNKSSKPNPPIPPTPPVPPVTGEIKTTVTVVDSASSDGMSNIPIEIAQENNISSIIAL